MEIPDLVRERLGDEDIRAGVSLGDEDAVCMTPTRTIVYRGEGLLSDESVTILSHDVERIDVSEGRRKTKFDLEYVDDEMSFSVPTNRAEKVLELLLEGVLRAGEVAEPTESVLGVYRFSELALVLTENRLVKHVGSSVWDEDFEEFAFEDVTGLGFEDGSVATQIVLSIDGRPQRIKAPNDEAHRLRQTLTEALCDFHGVDSLAALNDAVGVDEEGDGDEERASGASGGLTLDDDIDPLVGGGTDDSDGSDPMSSPRSTDTVSQAPDSSADPEAGDDAGGASAVSGASEPGSQADAEGGGQSTDAPASGTETDRDEETVPGQAHGVGSASGDAPAGDIETADIDGGAVDAGVSRDDVDAIEERLGTLTTAVKRQNELLRKQQQTIKQLVEELRQGR